MLSLLMWKWTCCRLQATETHTHIHTSPLFWAFVHFLPVILTNLGLSIELSMHKDTKKLGPPGFSPGAFFFSRLKEIIDADFSFFNLLIYVFIFALTLLTILVIQ